MQVAAAGSAGRTKKRGRRGGKKARQTKDGKPVVGEQHSDNDGNDGNDANGNDNDIDVKPLPIMIDTVGSRATDAVDAADARPKKTKKRQQEETSHAAAAAAGGGGDDEKDGDDGRPAKRTRRSKRGRSARDDDADDHEDTKPAVAAADPHSEFLKRQEAEMLARVQAKKSQPKPTVTRSIPFGESTGTGTGMGTAGFPDVDPNALPVADNELREYFRHMEKLMEEQEFETTDDMQLFIQNAYAELKGKELAIAGDFEGSRILEKLLRGSSDIQVRSQAYRFAGDFRRLVTHQFASHVVQTLLLLAADVVEREVDGEVAGFEKTMDEDDLDAEEIEWRNKLPSMEKILVALCGECDGEWSRLLLDPYASHVIRTLLNVLSGESLADDSSIRSKKSSKYNKNHNNAFVAKKPGVKRRTPESFAALLTSIVDSLTANLQDADLRIMATHPVANPVLQTLLEIPHASTTLVPAFLKDGEFFKMLIEHQVGSHLAEKLVAKSSAMAFAGLFETHIRPRFLELCNHPLANFVIQRVLDKVSDQTQLDVLLDIIEPEMERMLFRSRAGIVVKTIEACSRVPACQKRVLKALFAAVHTAGDDAKMKKCASVILLMTTYEKYEVLDLAPSLQGALMLQHVASFTPENAKLCVESIMAMEPESLFKWALDPIASRVVEAILASHTLALRTQRRLVRNFFGRFVELSSDKYGSHLVDKCWAVSNMDMRETIAQELADKMTSLAANFHAKFILRNCKVELYKKRRDEWVERQQAEIKRREMAMEMRSAPGGGGVAAAAAADDAGGVPEGGEKKKKKRKNPAMDEIDALFASKLK